MYFAEFKRTAATCTLVALFLASSALDAASEPVPSKAFPAGNIARARVSFRMAIFCLPTCSPDVSANFAADVKAADPLLAIAALPLPKRANGRLVVMSIENDVAHRMPPPDGEYLRHVGFGLSPNQVTQLSACQQALIFTFSHPSADAWKGLMSANLLLETLARKSGGLIWDDEAQAMYSPEEWKDKRIDTYIGAYPDVSTQIQLRVIPTKPTARAVTLGMNKFGLPDLLIEEFDLSNHLPISSLMNAIAQALIEGGQFDRFGHLDFDLRKFKSDTAGYVFVKFLHGGSTSVVHVTALQVTGAQAQAYPSSQLARIEFDRYPGSSNAEREEAMLTSLFGRDR